MGKTHTVRFEPVGIEMEVDEDETILNAAFRQGIMLMHGCKEGQCSACKSFLLDGEVDLDRYSTFALPDFEEAEGWTLLCRAHAYSDLEIELINYDEEILHGGTPPRTVTTHGDGGRGADARHPAAAAARSRTTSRSSSSPASTSTSGSPAHDDEHRSFSMANPPSSRGELEFMIKLYAGGQLLRPARRRRRSRPATSCDVTGPYGVFTLRTSSPRRLLFIGGGAGMAPILSLLRSMAEAGVRAPGDLLLRRAHRDRPLPPRGARGARPRAARFTFVPALSEAATTTAGPARAG